MSPPGTTHLSSTLSRPPFTIIEQTLSNNNISNIINSININNDINTNNNEDSKKDIMSYSENQNDGIGKHSKTGGSIQMSENDVSEIYDSDNDNELVFESETDSDNDIPASRIDYERSYHVNTELVIPRTQSQYHGITDSRKVSELKSNDMVVKFLEDMDKNSRTLVEVTERLQQQLQQLEKEVFDKGIRAHRKNIRPDVTLQAIPTDMQCQKLLEFIQDHLDKSTKSNTPTIKYVDESIKNQFRVVDPQLLAKEWGRIKGKPNISVKKLQRSFSYLVKNKKELKRISKWRYEIVRGSKRATEEDCRQQESATSIASKLRSRLWSPEQTSDDPPDTENLITARRTEGERKVRLPAGGRQGEITSPKSPLINIPSDMIKSATKSPLMAIASEGSVDSMAKKILEREQTQTSTGYPLYPAAPVNEDTETESLALKLSDIELTLPNTATSTTESLKVPPKLVCAESSHSSFLNDQAIFMQDKETVEETKIDFNVSTDILSTTVPQPCVASTNGDLPSLSFPSMFGTPNTTADPIIPQESYVLSQPLTAASHIYMDINTSTSIYSQNTDIISSSSLQNTDIKSSISSQILNQNINIIDTNIRQETGALPAFPSFLSLLTSDLPNQIPCSSLGQTDTSTADASIQRSSSLMEYLDGSGTFTPTFSDFKCNPMDLLTVQPQDMMRMCQELSR